MNDRELLEAAARAAGLSVQRRRLDDPMNADFLIDGNGVRNPGQRSYPWNPLTDDGDALRLAVKLKLNIGQGDVTVTADDEGDADVFELRGTDPYAATRRAIVRAAAAIVLSAPQEIGK